MSCQYLGCNRMLSKAFLFDWCISFRKEKRTIIYITLFLVAVWFYYRSEFRLLLVVVPNNMRYGFLLAIESISLSMFWSPLHIDHNGSLTGNCIARENSFRRFTNCLISLSIDCGHITTQRLSSIGEKIMKSLLPHSLSQLAALTLNKIANPQLKQWILFGFYKQLP